MVARQRLVDEDVEVSTMLTLGVERVNLGMDAKNDRRSTMVRAASVLGVTGS